ncbi:MAG: ATP-binding protein [Polyangiaceae bacterium]|nr:ATP-binding protein [Polyangiaceae bacterium]
MASVSGTHGAETPLVGLPWLMRLRWGAVAGQCLALTAARVLLAASLPWGLMGALVALTAASNVALARVSPRASGERLIPFVLVGDALVLTAMLIVSGGPANPFSVFFLVHVALASLLLRPRGAWGLVGLTVLAFGSLFLWPGAHAAHVHAVGATHLIGMWVSYALTASFVAYFIGKVSQALRDRDQHLAAVERLALQNERLATLSSFSANAAHELATPLATIGLAAKELASAAAREQSDRLEADAHLICREVARCRTILADIAARAGESVGEMPRRTTPRDIIGEIDRVLPRELAPRLVVRFEGEGAADAPVVMPCEALAQVLANLVKNAAEANDGERRPPGGASESIELRIAVDGRLVFHVLDRGPGLPTAIRSRIGEPFVTTKGHAGGLGLGVYLARSFAERLGGRLAFWPRPGGGLDAELALPVDAIGGGA